MGENDTAEQRKRPFHSFAFTLIEGRKPRVSLRISEAEDGFYALKVQKGSAANPIAQFTRTIPLDTVERFRDSLQSIGVFGWEEAYGDLPGLGVRRWTTSTVFKEGVFSVESKGGSDVPVGFDALLEELYRLDFPRPNDDAASSSSARSAAGLGAIRGLSAGDLGAYSSAFGGVDFSRMAESFKELGLPGIDASEMSSLLSQAQHNPQAFQRRMRDEFRHMPADEQGRLLDALAATGMASREWWERFLRG